MTTLATTARPRAASRAVVVVPVLTRHRRTSRWWPPCTWWAMWLTWGSGGREPHVLSTGCALLLTSARAGAAVADAVAGCAVARVRRRCGRVPSSSSLLRPGRRDARGRLLRLRRTARTGALRLGHVRRPPSAPARRRPGRRRRTVHQGLAALVGPAGPDPAVPGHVLLAQPGRYLPGRRRAAGIRCRRPGAPPAAPLGWVVAPLATAGVVFTTSRGSQLGLRSGSSCCWLRSCGLAPDTQRSGGSPARPRWPWR